MEDGHFEFDDTGTRCWWDAEIEGWIAETDFEWVSDRMRRIIEAHPEFQGWIED